MIFSKKLSLFFSFLALLLLLPLKTLSAGGITAAIYSGIAPNLLKFNAAVGASQMALANYVSNGNLSNPGNNSIESSSASIIGIPIGLNIRYLEKFYLVRLGMAYYFSFGGMNEIATNLNTQRRTVIEDIDVRVFEMPLSFAFNIRNDDFTRFYAGGGASLFFGSAQITHDSRTTTIENDRVVKLLPDYDVFSGFTVGAHLLIGAEVSLSESTSLSIEINFNFGQKAPVYDSQDSITGSEKANIQQAESLADPDILGVYRAGHDSRLIAYDTRHPNSLNFSGMSIIFSINYFLGVL